MPRPRPSLLVARFRVVAVPALLTSALAVGVIGAFGPTAASADGTSLPIGDEPIALTQPTDPGIGEITPAADAAEHGMFGPQVDWPVVPLHAALARNGHLVTFGTPVHDAVQAGLTYDDWSSVADSHTQAASMHDYNSFCNALVELPDGRLLMVGGNSSMSSMVYDPTTGGQDMGAPLHRQRWYVTTLRRPDGQVVVLGGGNAYNSFAFQHPEDSSGVATTPEIGNGTGAWRDLSGATSTDFFGAVDNHWYYPRAFNAPSGDVVGMSGNEIWSLSTDGDGTVRRVGTLPFDPRVSGTQVLYAPGRVLVVGGGETTVELDTEGLRDAAVVSLGVNGSVSTRSTTPMHLGRNFANATVLPDGKVLVDGGTRVGIRAGDDNAVRQAEVWDPATEQWTLAATARRTRSYHATSVLLPSGAVFTGGGGIPGPEVNFNAELYYPASLFTKRADGTVAWASRPTITSIAGAATLGGTVSLGLGDDRVITQASRISLPATTHSQNTDQRRIPLDVHQRGRTLTAALPSAIDTMPPGDYELTVVDADGVPSPAQIVTIRKDAPGLVTPAEVRAATTTAAPSAAPSATTTTPPAEAPAPVPASSPAPVASSAPAPVVTAPVAASSLHVGVTVSLQPADRAGVRVARSRSSAVLRRVGRSSSAGARRAATWIVRAGLRGKGGWSFESADRHGFYLTAPADGTGAMGVAKRSRSSAFAARATFSVVPGVLEHDTSIRSATRTDRYLGVKGARLVIGALPRSTAGLSASTFVVGKGLASAR